MATRLIRYLADLLDAPAPSAGSVLGWSAQGKLANVDPAASLLASATPTFTGPLRAQSFITSNGWGGITSAGTGQFNGVQSIGYSTGGGPATMAIQSYALDGATALGGYFNNGVALTTAGARLFDFRNNGVSKTYIDKDGGLFIGQGTNAYITGAGSAAFAQGIQTPIYSNQGPSSTQFLAQVADGPSAVAVVVNNSTPLAATGSKLLSIRNAGVEKVSVGFDGKVGTPGLVNDTVQVLVNTTTPTATANGTTALFALQKGGVSKMEVWDNGTTWTPGEFNVGGFIRSPNGILAYYGAGGGNFGVFGGATDSATAKSVRIGSAVALATAGAKVLSIVNGGADSEVAYFDKDGGLTVGGNPVGRKVAVPATATSTGTPGDFAADASFAYFCTAANTWRRVATSTW